MPIGVYQYSLAVYNVGMEYEEMQAQERENEMKAKHGRS